MEKGDPCGSPWWMTLLVESQMLSVVLGEQQGRYGPIGFCDDPELRAIRAAIHGEKAEALLEGHFILLPVVLVNVTPVAGLMALDASLDVLRCQPVERVWRGDDPAELEPGDGLGLRAQVTPPATASCSWSSRSTASISSPVSVQWRRGSLATTAHLNR